ncbi:hypothetical protein K470DRAFT_247499 [Piedraia hortae CBS 480.64]|uniref:Cyclin-like domain-containing protein n=1 Tax=Piedraia hortae CBS 480.64 TaxID=1314780 RepID=A0A6A7BZ45_9PEZI|nr:hypothetical protein K470DRAFT_247499 [Piedraia hortae CBS 480.64]
MAGVMPPKIRIGTLVPSTRPVGKPKRKKAAPPATPCGCDEPDIGEDADDGKTVCRNCGTQISECNIVNEVQFEETAGGAAQVQGAVVGQHARHANTMGEWGRRMGDSNRSRSVELEREAAAVIGALGARYDIEEDIRAEAKGFFSLIANSTFHRGRRTDQIAGCCLYYVCRKRPEKALMLIDFAEHVGANVFHFGELYKDLLKRYGFSTDTESRVQHLIDWEELIMRYCKKLDFGPATKDVASDSLRILKRMRRDWIATGRHPAGLAGACLLLGARMNNFNRSVREIVYVLKISDQTIAKRVYEFRQTKSATLSLAEFREKALKIKHSANPPALENSKRKQKQFATLKRKRSEQHERSAGLDESLQEGIPPEVLEEPPRKRGRQFKPEPVVLTDEDLIEEAVLEAEIQETMDEEVVQEAGDEVSRQKAADRAKALAYREREAADAQARKRRDTAGMSSWWNPQTPSTQQTLADAEDGIEGHPVEEYTAEQLELEFCNDPEVDNCLLSQEEVKLKEGIWLAHNDDWLREHYAREMRKKALAKGGKGAKGRKKKGRAQSQGNLRLDADGNIVVEESVPEEQPVDDGEDYEAENEEDENAFEQAMDHAEEEELFASDSEGTDLFE